MATAKYVSQQVFQRAGMIAWTTALGAITPEASAERSELSVDAAREGLEEAVDLGLLERHSLLVGYSDLYTVTNAGRRLARKHAAAGSYTYPQGLRVARVTIKDARHTIACVSVVAALERRYRDHRVIAERELHREESEQKRRLASVDVRRDGQRRSHYPDAVIWPPGVPGEPEPLPVGVEIELTFKSKEGLIAICRGLARGVQIGQIEAALYYVENRKLEERLLGTVEELKVQDMIIVNPLSEIIGPLPGFEFSPWRDEEITTTTK